MKISAGFNTEIRDAASNARLGYTYSSPHASKIDKLLHSIQGGGEIAEFKGDDGVSKALNAVATAVRSIPDLLKDLSKAVGGEEGVAAKAAIGKAIQAKDFAVAA